MTATGSHEYFYSLRGAQPPGEGYFAPFGAVFCFSVQPAGEADDRQDEAHAAQDTVEDQRHVAGFGIPEKHPVGKELEGPGENEHGRAHNKKSPEVGGGLRRSAEHGESKTTLHNILLFE